MKLRALLLVAIVSTFCGTLFAQEDQNKMTDSKPKWGSNILTFAPLQLTENGVGASIAYEKVLDNAGFVAATFPFHLTFDMNNDTYTDKYGVKQNGHIDAMYYFMPGLKIYPTGCYGFVKYAIGPSIVVASGQRSDPVYGSLGTVNGYETKNHFLMGMIVNNSLNVNPTEKLYLGVDFGFGFTYLNRIAGFNNGTRGLVQFGLKIGYRF